MDRSRSKRQVLILDCCHSGSFAQGSKAMTGESVGTKSAFEGTGYGRVVLTATDATQYAWEGDQVIGDAQNSVFTLYLLQGLRTGEADSDGDGKITLDELYDYVYDKVVSVTPMQTPGKWSYRQQGELVIATNPRPVLKPATLPDDMQQSMGDARAWVREGAVSGLKDLLQGNDRPLALAASDALKRLASDDSRKVAAAEEVVWPFPHSVAFLGPWQFYHGYCLLVSRSHATELSRLPDAERRAYLDEMCLLARAVETACRPHKLNYELLGNQVPHLHWHLFPRYLDDADRLHAVWLAVERATDDEVWRRRMETGREERATTVANLRQALKQMGAPQA